MGLFPISGNYGLAALLLIGISAGNGNCTLYGAPDCDGSVSVVLQIRSLYAFATSEWGRTGNGKGRACGPTSVALSAMG